MTELRGLATAGQTHGIISDLLEEEKYWLDNMPSEYDEIMLAQSIIDELKTQ